MRGAKCGVQPPNPELRTPNSEPQTTHHAPRANQPTKIIALTASAFDEDRERVLIAGCDDFVSKPFRENSILEKMTEHLGVQYIYQDGQINQPVQVNQKHQACPNLASPIFQNSLLTTMSSNWLEQMRKAAIRGSDDRLTQLIQEMPPTFASLAETFTSWVENFQFDKVIDFVQSESTQNPAIESYENQQLN